MADPAVRERIKSVIIESLGLEGMSTDEIGDEMPLFGEEGLGLDSVDALELMVVLEKDFGVQMDTENVDPEVFATVASLEQFLAENRSG